MFRTIQPRLLLLSALPLLLALYFISTTILSSYRTVRDMNILNIGTLLAIKSSSLIHEVQKERGTTSLFLGSNGKKYLTELSDQYKRTDLYIENLKKHIEAVAAVPNRGNFQAALDNAANQWKRINVHREKVNAQSISNTESIEFYTQLNSMLLNLIDVITKASHA